MVREQRLRAILRDESAAVAILFVFMTIGLFGFVALSIDTSMWYSTKRRMQTAADAAARAGAYVVQQAGYAEAAVVERARADAAKLGFSAEKGAQVDVASDPRTRSVEVTISAPMTLNFARLFLDSPPIARVGAAAAAAASPPPCLTLLGGDSEAPRGLISGLLGGLPLLGGLLGGGDNGSSGMKLENNSRITAPPCRVQVNGTSDKALSINASYIEAARICVVGGVSGRGTSVPVERGCAVMPDPLAAWQPPPPRACDWLAKRVISGAAVTVTPESYCAGLEISRSEVTFSPGIYYLNGGTLAIRNGSRVVGEGVAFLIGGTARIEIDASTVDLKAPTSGPMAGFVFAHTRDASTSTVHQFTNAADVRYEGAIYLPKQAIVYDGKSTSANVPPFTTYIVQVLVLGDTAHLMLNNDYAASDVPVVGLIGAGVVLTK